MTWSDTPIDGQQSVAANKAPINNAFTYIANEMKNDHFWDNANSNLDGRHQFVQMPKSAADVAIATDMDSVLYSKDTTEGRSEIFHRNAEGIYQLSPSFLSGTHVVTGSFTDMQAVPANSYGEVFMFITSSTGKKTFQRGGFVTDATLCESWPYGQRNQGSSTAVFNVSLGNGSSASGLNIRVRSNEAAAGSTWTYRVIYWEI